MKDLVKILNTMRHRSITVLLLLLLFVSLESGKRWLPYSLLTINELVGWTDPAGRELKEALSGTKDRVGSDDKLSLSLY